MSTQHLIDRCCAEGSSIMFEALLRPTVISDLSTSRSALILSLMPEGAKAL